jgi:hypothetical protein
MSESDLDLIVEQHHRALDAVVRGDPAFMKKLFSKQMSSRRPIRSARRSGAGVRSRRRWSGSFPRFRRRWGAELPRRFGAVKRATSAGA